MHPKTIKCIGVDFVHGVGLGLGDFSLAELGRDKVAGAVFTEEEVPECVHEKHGDALAAASDSKV